MKINKGEILLKPLLDEQRKLLENESVEFIGGKVNKLQNFKHQNV